MKLNLTYEYQTSEKQLATYKSTKGLVITWSALGFILTLFIYGITVLLLVGKFVKNKLCLKVYFKTWNQI